MYGVTVPERPLGRCACQPPLAGSADGALQGMVQLLSAMYRTAAAGSRGRGAPPAEEEGARLIPKAARAALMGLTKLQVRCVPVLEPPLQSACTEPACAFQRMED